MNITTKLLKTESDLVGSKQASRTTKIIKDGSKLSPHRLSRGIDLESIDEQSSLNSRGGKIKIEPLTSLGVPDNLSMRPHQSVPKKRRNRKLQDLKLQNETPEEKQERLAREKLDKYMKSTVNINKKIIKFKKKKADDTDYSQLKDEIRKMNKMIKRSDIEGIHKRQKIINQQRNREEPPESLKDPMDLMSLESEQAKTGDTNRLNVGQGKSKGTNSQLGSYRRPTNATMGFGDRTPMDSSLGTQKNQFRNIPSLKKMITMSKNYTKIQNNFSKRDRIVESDDSNSQDFLEENQKANEVADFRYRAAKPLLKRINMRSRSRGYKNRTLTKKAPGGVRSMSNLRASTGNKIRINKFSPPYIAQTLQSPVVRMQQNNISANIGTNFKPSYGKRKIDLHTKSMERLPFMHE